MNAAKRPGYDGKVTSTQRCKDGDPGCDADTVPGTCTFTVGLCFDRIDARFARKNKQCTRSRLAGWMLLKPTAAADPTNVAALVGAVAALGATTSGSSVTFTPPHEVGELCTASVAIVVPTKGARPGTRLFKSRTTAVGAPADGDTLKLVCLP